MAIKKSRLRRSKILLRRKRLHSSLAALNG
jgi:hypothetical protein